MTKSNPNGFVSVNISSGHAVYNTQSLRSDEVKLFKSYLETYFELRIETSSEASDLGISTSTHREVVEHLL